MRLQLSCWLEVPVLPEGMTGGGSVSRAFTWILQFLVLCGLWDWRLASGQVSQFLARWASSKVISQHGNWLSTEWMSQRARKPTHDGHHSFCDLISVETSHHFCCILSLGSRHSQREGITWGLRIMMIHSVDIGWLPSCTSVVCPVGPLIM